MQQNERKGVPWIVIVVALFVFWPVGLYLLVKREPSNLTRTRGTGKGMIVTAIVFYFLTAIVLLGCMEEGIGKDDVVGLSIMTSIGVIFHVLGLRKKKLVKKIQQYTEIIVNGKVRKLNKIVVITGKPYDEVHSDVQDLIQKGVIPNAYIDESTCQIVVTTDEPEIEKTEVQPEIKVYSFPSGTGDVHEEVPRVVKCSSCGAKNKITGAYGECEYCGSQIS